MFRPIPRLVRAATKRPARLLSTRIPATAPPRWSPWIAGAAAVSLWGVLALNGKSVALDAAPLARVPNRAVDADEVRKHCTPESAWVVIDSVVYDITEFLELHPGGEEVILLHLGKDISPIFNLLHARGSLARLLEDSDAVRIVGHLVPGSTLEKVAASSQAVQERRKNLPPLDSIRNCAQFERLAMDVLGKDERFNANKNSWSFLRFLPRVNVPVRAVSTETTFLGNPAQVPLPIFYCPTGQTTAGHPDGELNLTRSAAATGVPQIVSTMAGISITECAAERDRLVKDGKARAPLWWQLYIFTDRKESERRMRDAVKAGCEAILITVDAPEIGNREADAKPPSSSLMESNLSWDDIAWVRRTIKDLAPDMPVLLKGVGCVADVELAKQYGADGVLLSNHGGRQLDHAPPPLATLVRLRLEQPALLEDPKFAVFVDGGVSRGTDVLKALCLGAKGVGLGRVTLYAQTCYGDAGVIRATEILQREVTSGMRLLGATSIKELKPEMVELLDGLLGRKM